MSTRWNVLFVGPALLFLVGPLGGTWAVLDGLPAYGEGDESISAGELLGEGTNLSAPLAPFLALVVALLATRRRDRWGTVGDVVVIVVVLVMLVASIREPWVPSQADSPAFLLVLFHVALYAVGAAVLTSAARDLLARRRAPDRESALAAAGLTPEHQEERP